MVRKTAPSKSKVVRVNLVVDITTSFDEDTEWHVHRKAAMDSIKLLLSNPSGFEPPANVFVIQTWLKSIYSVVMSHATRQFKEKYGL